MSALECEVVHISTISSLIFTGRRLIDWVFGLATLIEIAETDRSDMASKRSVTAISIS